MDDWLVSSFSLNRIAWPKSQRTPRFLKRLHLSPDGSSFVRILLFFVNRNRFLKDLFSIWFNQRQSLQRMSRWLQSSLNWAERCSRWLIIWRHVEWSSLRPLSSLKMSSASGFKTTPLWLKNSERMKESSSSRVAILTKLASPSITPFIFSKWKAWLILLSHFPLSQGTTCGTRTSSVPFLRGAMVLWMKLNFSTPFWGLTRPSRSSRTRARWLPTRMAQSLSSTTLIQRWLSPWTQISWVCGTPSKFLWNLTSRRNWKIATSRWLKRRSGRSL